MNINREITEKFSTFFNVEERPGTLKIKNLQTMLKLANNFHTIFQSCPDGKAEYFAQSFVKKLQTNNHTKLDEEHLSAYLEEACFKLAIKELYQQLRPLNYKPLDCFQEARIVASQPINIYKTYNFIESNPMTWGTLQIKRKVKQIAYLGKEFCKYHTWSAPKYLSEKILREALQNKLAIKTKKETESYVLAVKSYKEIYRSSLPKKIEGKLPEPSQAQWEEIKKYYNLRCAEYNKKPSEDESDRLEIITNFQVIKEKIQTCVKVARNYICSVENIQVVYPEIIAGKEHEVIAVNHQEKEIETEQKQQIVSICLDEFDKLPPESQKLMQLFYGLEISQTDMKEIFNLQQYQISRKIKRSEKQILTGLVNWSKVNLEIIPNEGIIKEKNQPLKDWLRYYFKKQFQEALQENLLEQQKEKIPMLRLYYGEGSKLDDVAKKLNTSSHIITDKIKKVKENLERFLREWVRKKMDIDLPNSANKRIVSFVEEWLKDAPYAMWN